MNKLIKDLFLTHSGLIKNKTQAALINIGTLISFSDPLNIFV